MEHIIIVARDTDGSLGLMIEGTENNEKIQACQVPLLITHDCVEHMNGIEHLGTSTDEFQALGAVHYGRGFGEEIHLHIDIENTWECVYSHWETLEDVGDIECDEREYFEEQVLMAGAEDEPDLKRLTVNLLCLGYNQAEKRFGDRLSAYDTFARVKDCFTDWMKSPSYGVEGTRLKLTYNTNGQEAQLTEIYK